MVAASGFSRQQIPFQDKSSMCWRQSQSLLWKQELNLRSSHCSFPTEKHLYWSLFLIELQAKRLNHMFTCGVFTNHEIFKNLRTTASETVVSPGVYFLISYTLAQIDAWFLYHCLQFRLSILPSLLILLILVILVLVWWCSAKKVFLQISQDSQEKSCTKVSFLKKLQIHRV